MKNYYFITVMVGLLFMGCSVDNDELKPNNDPIRVANSIMEVNGCESVTYDFHSSLGEFVITNDNEDLYLNFMANDGFLIYDIRWEVMPSEADLPINANGINSARLDQRDKFNSGTNYHGETVAISDYGDNPGYVILAAEVILKNSSDEKFTIWVGSESEFKNGSNFMIYSICDPTSDPVCTINAGADNSVTYTRAYVESRVSSSNDVDPLFYELVSEGATPGGTISPGVGTILPNYEKNPYQTFTTKYIVTDGDCTDFAILSITIVDSLEPSDPVCTVNAGADKSVTYTRSYVESRVSSSRDVEPLFYELVSEDATPGGTLSPGVGVILPSYEKNPYQTFTTKYIVKDGDCTDFAVLSITVVP